MTAVFSAGFLGGSELFNLEFLHEARNHGVEIDAIIPSRGSLANALEPLVRSIQVIEVPMPLTTMSRFDRNLRLSQLPRRLVALRHYSRQVRQALEQTNGLVCCFGVRSQLAVAAAGWRLRRRICWIVHEVVPSGPTLRIWGFASRRADAIFTYSKSAASQPGLEGARVSVFPVRMDIESFLELPFPNAPPRVLGLVGDLFPIKNHLGFVDVVRRLRASGEAVEGRMIGRDTSTTHPTREYVRVVHDALGADVTLTAASPGEMPSALAQVDLLMHLSTVPESFGRVCVEAMAAGRPVVAFGHGGVAEVVSETGILCQVDNLDDVARAVLRLRHEPELYRTMSARARAVASARWGPGQAGPFIGDALAALARGES